MSGRATAQVAKLLTRLTTAPDTYLGRLEDGSCVLVVAGAQERVRIAAEAVRALLTAGLIAEDEGGRLRATSAASAWLIRTESRDNAFRAQHDRIEPARPDEAGPGASVNRTESPVSALARRAASNGEPWLADDAVAAAERLRRDFEIGQLQPRITANWSASVASGGRSAGGLSDLTDMAMAARLRFERAVEEVGPELSGLLVDVCCFVKGLELVERERQWPARSAKLVLRLGLERLARHYGLAAAAQGPASAGPIRHWGAEGYRPQIG